MKQWSFFTSNEIRPAGWIRRQLEIQAEGLSGHLDEIWPDVRDSRWIVLDYASVIVHIFNDEVREFYSLERLWSDAKIEEVNFEEE